MSLDVRIPTLGESITEAVIVRWLKADGEAVEADENLLELETEKASVEIPAEKAGVLKILKAEGETVQVGDVVGQIETGGAKGTGTEKKKERNEPAAAEPKTAPVEEAKPTAAPANSTSPPSTPRLSPLARRLAEDQGVDATGIAGSGRGGRVTKADVEAHLAGAETKPVPRAPEPARPAVAPAARAGDGDEERVAMSPIRRRIAERLVQAQQTAAILTTFNEIDMSTVLDLRRRFKERFLEVHGVSLGFMSFFCRACTSALQEIPELNAEIQEGDIVYKKHVHLGIAVGTERGLVVPVVRSAELLSFAEIEKEIERLAKKARDGKLSIQELSGGTFSITNGGVFGSLLSTPILNPPQSGILGMHKIEKRPVVVDDQVTVRPMMYVALSYDHRIVDGQQAVTFLVRVKERLEDPARLLLDL